YQSDHAYHDMHSFPTRRSSDLETTPHMHFAFMPVTYDEKREREKVSAKEVLNRNELKSFHQDLDNHLKERIPQIYQKGVLNDKTIGVEDVPTLKKHSKEI